MEEHEKNLDNVTDETISEMFKDYVASMEDKERHTKAACDEVNSFDKFSGEQFPNDIKMQRELYDKMMDVAVEFEESGFIAGVKWVLALIKRKETS